MGDVLKNAGIEAPERLPLMKITESPEELTKKIDHYREETKRFLYHFNKLKDNYPEFFDELNKKHPGLNVLINKTEKLGSVAASEMNSEEMAKILITYNFYGEQINHVIEKLNREIVENQERSFVESMNVQVDSLPVELSPEEEAEIKAFTQELWEEMFPESNVDRFMGWVTGQKISEQGKLRWFFAPANGIEAVVMGAIDMFKPTTYTDLVDTAQYMYGMSWADLCDTLQIFKMAYDNASTDDSVNVSISLIYSMVFFGGGLKKMASRLEHLKCAKKLKLIIRSINGARAVNEKLKPLPAAIMSNMALSYGK